MSWSTISKFRINEEIKYFRENVQVFLQSMPEIPETHLYYTKVLLPS